MSSTIHKPATRSLRTVGGRLVAAAAIIVAALAGVLVTAGPASAHDQLVGTDPKAGATVDALPGQLTLTFSADVLPDAGATVVEVMDAAGSPVTDGSPAVSGNTVTQPLVPPADENGVYSVGWKVVSGDGHPISGDFVFTVAGAPSVSPTPSATASSPPFAPTPSPSETVLYDDMTVDPVATVLANLLLVLIAAAVLAIVIVAVVLARRGRRRRPGAGDGPSGQA